MYIYFILLLQAYSVFTFGFIQFNNKKIKTNRYENRIESFLFCGFVNICMRV